jgi:hypothetical protein
MFHTALLIVQGLYNRLKNNVFLIEKYLDTNLVMHFEMIALVAKYRFV